ncbi:neutral/alkaline ceramidase-like enzyme [Larkinella arboricola]|uniref:Neutral/alkaline ceramidase-like enzyme n=1 Tax=Larkinella arboricola TaxID=643671 RepID=A0A327X561_LARAB|nr:neutral/alkaline non-lysosomal ceramidase N-terminal domain-containing protein [Larkinella arboricola]RAK02035.1 neutral/alkaline ceramidase-like enzyme [Larkinella arboricola]
MKYLRILLKTLLGLVGIILLFLAVSLAPVSDTPYRKTDYYAHTRQRLLHLPRPLRPQTGLQAGWAKVNLTPSFTTPTGGYGVRRGEHWKTVSDSIYVRTVVLTNGSTKVALVALDLLITPPTVTEQLKKRLPEIGFQWENVFTGAIHSHNSLGGWAPGLVGGLFAGEFDQRVVDHITNAVLKSITLAQRQLAPAEVGFTQIAAPELVYNRMNNEGEVDGNIRLLKLRKKTGESALLCTYGGHATIFRAADAQYLSRDYPGVLVDQLEKQSGSFALFMAGSVGSTGSKVREEKDVFRTIRNYADSLTNRIVPALPQVKTRPDSTLELLTLPLELREPHPRVVGNWRVRPWLFYSVYGDYPSDLKALRIGQTVLLGTPCDFSGELVPALLRQAGQKGFNLMVTSFNGGYVGYITPDQYYHKQAYETQTMNWFGPENGAYFVEMMKGLLVRL